MAEKKKEFKKPKTFTADSLIDLFRAFCEEIEERDYYTMPTQTAFCKWLRDAYRETDRKTIYNSLNRYFPGIKSEYDRILSDTVVNGVAKGKYRDSISIFALKNWCKWSDRQDITAAATVAQVDDADKAMMDKISKRLGL